MRIVDLPRNVSILVSKRTPLIKVIQGFLTTVLYLIHPISSRRVA